MMGINSPVETMNLDALKKEMLLLGSHERLPTLLDWHFPMWMAGREDEWFAILGDVWEVLDYVGIYLDDLIDVLPEDGPIASMMTAEELQRYRQLPEVVTIYRGAGKINKYGLSWSLSEEIAKTFPSLNRYWQKYPMLYTAQVMKSQILALKLDRGEEEVITVRAEILKSRRIGRFINTAPGGSGQSGPEGETAPTDPNTHDEKELSGISDTLSRQE